MIFLYVLLCIYSLQAIISCTQMDESIGDVSSIFYNIPETDTLVVPLQFPNGRHKRRISDKHELHFSAFGKNFSLYFQPKDHVLMGSKTPIIKATGDYRGEFIDYENYDHVKSQLNFQTLLDEENNAAAIQFDTLDKVGQMEGMIADRYVFSTLTNNSDFDEIRIFQIPTVFNPDVHSEYFTDTETAHIINMTSSKRESIKKTTIHSNIPDTVYPEILLVADHTMHTYYQNNVLNIVKYLLGFWTAVDLRYRELISPKVRLNIAGIIIATNKSATPYLRGRGSYLYGDFTITAMVEDTSIPRIPNLSYDILVLMTRKEIYGISHSGRLVVANGIASVGTGCGKLNFEVRDEFGNTKKTIHQVLSAAAIRDYGLYSASFTAAHELAHILGADHDGSESQRQNSYCPEKAGYLMNSGEENAALRHPQVGMNRFFFSKCSKLAMRALLNFGNSECFYNKPDIGDPVYKPLPGATSTFTEQCQELFGKKARHRKSGGRPCERIDCFVYLKDVKRWVGVTANEPPAEGTPCEKGTDKICLNGKCDHAPSDLRGKYEQSNNYIKAI